MTVYSKRIGVTKKEMEVIHNQLKQRKHNHPFLDIRDDLRKWDIDQQAYYTAKANSKISTAMLEKLIDMNVIIPDRILKILYQESKSSI